MTPAVSLIVMAIGPERVVARAIASAMCQTVRDAEIVVVHDSDEGAIRSRTAPLGDERPIRPMASGSRSASSVRQAAINLSSGACFIIIDGSTQLAADYVETALAALAGTPDAAFAAARGGMLFDAVAAGPQAGHSVDAPLLVSSPWAVGPAVIRREMAERTGPYADSLPALADWDILLTMAEGGLAGVLIPREAPRYSDDDVHLREAIRPPSYLPALRQIVIRHHHLFARLTRTALVERERTIRSLFEYERDLLARRQRALSALEAMRTELDALKPALARHDMPILDPASLFRREPFSRNWGSERGRPVDRYYIHQFLARHAADVHGHVLEMLDPDLTVTYGGSRVDRSDVLDIDPGNGKASVIADLRVAQQLPSDVYDCFILTQTLHLIDDMPAALRTAYQLLKPGGVLLATLPCASMVATEYGARGDHWRVTDSGARVLFEQVFTGSNLEIQSHGNLLTTTAFLHGLACEDLAQSAFDVDDPAYPLIVSVRAEKPRAASISRPSTARKVGSGILLYHRVADLPSDHHRLAVTPSVFRSQVEHLRKTWHIVPLRTLAAAAAAGEIPERQVALTFDDGYLDNLEVVAPLLAELDVPATFFLTSEARPRERRFWWDVLEDALVGHRACPDAITIRTADWTDTLATQSPAERRHAHDVLYGLFKISSPVVRDDLLDQLTAQTSVPLVSSVDRAMSADEVRRLCSYADIEIGAHTVHHPSLPALSADDCQRETQECRTALERLTERAVTSFAYPFGDVSAEAVEAAMAAGYSFAVTCEPRGLRRREHPLRLPRIPTQAESGEELDIRLRTLLSGDAERNRAV